MTDLLHGYITEQTDRLRICVGSSLLTEQTVSRFLDVLNTCAYTIAESTLTGFISKEAISENPYAGIAPELITNDQRKRAIGEINRKIKSSELELPPLLVEVLKLRLTNMTDAFMEMLARMSEHKQHICSTLTGGKTYSRIEDITLSAGDNHNHGRFVMILQTDAGKLVYKPHDMRGEVFAYELAQRFFNGVVGIPRNVSFGDEFGVCEFMEKRRSEGEEAAKRFFFNMGGCAAFIKILGSTDMHIENVTCACDKPYILDLETILSPQMVNRDYARLHPELSKMKSRSPYLSGLLPNEQSGRQYSILMNDDADGCLPEVNGKRVSVIGYLDEFKSGYHDTYSCVLKQRDELSEYIISRSGSIPVRLLIRNTQYYHDMLLKLYHKNALSSADDQSKTIELLSKIMHNNVRKELKAVVESEIRQLQRGDIPYYYTYANSRDLYSDGRIVAKDIFEGTAADHAVANIAAMCEADEASDLGLIERAVVHYPGILSPDEREKPVIPLRPIEPISKDLALSQALKMFDRLFELALPSPDKKLFWGYLDESTFGLRYCEAGLANGLSGIALFAAAYAHASGNERKRAQMAVDELVIELNIIYDYLLHKRFAPEHAPFLGESVGVGGILTALALIKRYSNRSDIEDLQNKALHMLAQFDLLLYGAPDRMIGMAGLLSALCRFEEYHDTGLIRNAADSLLAMKTLEYRGQKLWRSFPDSAQPISGAGHGHAGIAEALYAASALLGSDRYLTAANEALKFELETYSEKFCTWPDLRSIPPVGYMHGYCSGAPGIGIMAKRISGYGFSDDVITGCAELAKITTDTFPLNVRDHLCCGNCAVAEYYMTAGMVDEAGKVLGAMKARCDTEGEYRYMGYDYRNSVTATLFYGVSGIGYEMLRYAASDRILSVI